MAVMNVFKTTTMPESPLDGSRGNEAKPAVSDFLTVQSFTNFAAMTGAITAAWHGLERLTPSASPIWVPYAFAFGWALISVAMSIEGLKKAKDKTTSLDFGSISGAVFIALINSLVLAGAVIGTERATGRVP